ncbi:MAG: ABC transporter permease [Gemmatimonadales bacterium]
MPAPRHRRLFRLPFSRATAAEVDDEFQFHLLMRARDLERLGHSPERARAMALAEFGDIDDARRVCRAEDEERMRDHRRSQWLDGLRQDLWYAVRGLRRQPGFALSIVLTLGLAIGIAASAYGVVHAYLVRPLPYPEADRLVRVVPEAANGRLPDPERLQQIDWSVADRVFAATASWNPDGFTIAGTDRTESVRGAWVSAPYFTVLGKRPALGRVFEPAEHAGTGSAVILSDALWSRLFARDPSLVGRAIRVQSLEVPDRAELVTVVGILPPDSWHVDQFTDLLRPMPPGPQYPMMARLEPGVTIQAAEARLNALVLPQMPGVDSAFRFTLVGAQEAYTRSVRTTLIALVGGALFLLLIAGANIAGAKTARAVARRAEIQLRLALGASRARVIQQLLVENLLVAGLAGLAGAVLAGAFLASVGAIVGERLGTGVPGGGGRLALGPGMLASIAAAGALVGTAFGLVPALLLTRRAAAADGVGEAMGGVRGGATAAVPPALRWGLIVAQVAFTVMLLAGAGLMGRTILAIALTPLGFDERQVVQGNLFLPPTRYPDDNAIRRGLAGILAEAAVAPGIRATAGAFPDPLRGFVLPPARVSSDVGGSAGVEERPASSYVVTPGFFESLAIPVNAGRAFGEQDGAEALPVAIVSETLARQLWPGQAAIGRRLRTAEDSVWRTVVGVAGEIRLPVEAAPSGELYLPFGQRPIRLVFLLARVSGDPAGQAAELQRAVSRADDGLGLGGVAPLDDLASRMTGRHQALATVLSVFALLALGLAMLGLYASLAYVVAQRRREIAIRVAVGADRWSVCRLVAREGAMLVTVGLALGLALSLSLTGLLRSQLYGVTPTDPATYAAIVALLGGSALIAAIAPLQQASRVNPVEILRTE